MNYIALYQCLKINFYELNSKTVFRVKKLCLGTQVWMELSLQLYA